jgi:hypothetical protein
MCLCGTLIDTTKTQMNKLIRFTLLIFLVTLAVVASDQEDAAADAVAKAFLQARQAAHLSKLERMGRNTFRKRVCKHDDRMPSGWINEVAYETFDLAELPDSAQRLASSPDSYKIASRFGIGVCMVSDNSAGRPRYSVLIATYESRLTSFWRIFWE